jgi:hypothetical protein
MANDNPTQINREALNPAPISEPKPEQKAAPAQPDKSDPAPQK